MLFVPLLSLIVKWSRGCHLEPLVPGVTLSIEMRVSAGLPADAEFRPWALAFRQFSFSHIGQPLRCLLGGLQPTLTHFTRMLCSELSFLFP